MELGQHQLQILVNLVAVLSAAFVALICDFLKGNNEQLHELIIELRARREQEQKRSHLITPRGAERVERPGPPIARSAVAKEKKRTVNAGALAAMERGAALADSGTRPGPEVFGSQQEPAAVKTAAKTDWGSLLSRNAAPATHSSASAQADESLLPAGSQAWDVLNKLLQSRLPISGMVVSIGVNASCKSDGSLPESVINLVQSLIGPNDFAAQSGDDEFLLIYQQERGASAQRRLSQIARKLWDFQLRSLGSFQILFSWGGVEVRSESIEEALASASERMQETRRGRKLLTMASPAPAAETQLRQAV